MQAIDLLHTFAEVGIGLAGFTGIVAALQARRDIPSLASFRYLIGYSLGCVVFALLPLVLMLALPDTSAWRVASAGLAGGGLLAIFPYWLPGSRLRPSTIGWAEKVSTGLMATLVLALSSVAAGFLSEQAAFVYLVGLFYSLGLGLWSFVNLLSEGSPDA